MVYGRTEIWYSWTGKPEDQGKDHFFPLGVIPNMVVDPPKISLLILENKAQSPTTCNVLIKKEVFDKMGMFLEHFKGMFEDAAFFCKAALFAHIYVSDSTWARYRQHHESCSSIASITNHEQEARYTFLQWFESYLNLQPAVPVQVRIRLYKEMFPYRHRFVNHFISTLYKLSRRVLNKAWLKL
jgi:hypothetical protein